MIRLIIVLVAFVATACQDCGSTDAVYTLHCNRELDPWKETRAKMETLEKDSEFDSLDDAEIWKRVRGSLQTIESVAENSVDVAETAITESAKKAQKSLKKGIKIAKAIASVAQLVGPIIDIILLFAPTTKSTELVAIEAGFAKIGAKIDSVAYNLENIRDASAWNAIVPELLEFEGTVHHTTEKYKQLVEEIKAADHSRELPLDVKGKIEDLVDAIRLSGGIGNKLQMVDNLFRGNSGLTDGKNLVQIFVDAVDNDCSKILPMANSVIGLVKDAQRLQYFYEINKQLVKPMDDKGYPKMIYDMYGVTMNVYETCTKHAILNAREVMVCFRLLIWV